MSVNRDLLIYMPSHMPNNLSYVRKIGYIRLT